MPEAGSPDPPQIGYAVDAANTSPVVGIYDRSPELYLHLIRDLVPEERLRVCTRWDGIGAILPDVDVLLANKFPKRQFPREEILASERLEWVQLAGAGVDHITPFDPAKIMVTNASGIHGPTMSEYILGTLVHMLWDFPRLLRQQRERQWDLYEVPTLGGKTAGVVGVGHIGSTFAKRAKAFGMRVIGTRRSGGSVSGVDAVYGPEGLPTVMTDADVVVLTVPRTPETMNLIGRAELELMKPTAYLINVSRGGIVDEAALLALLKRGKIAGAVLDVFEREPLPSESEFWSLPNVLVTPHISSEFRNWPAAVAELFVANLRRWMAGEPLEKVVDPALGY